MSNNISNPETGLPFNSRAGSGSDKKAERYDPFAAPHRQNMVDQHLYIESARHAALSRRCGFSSYLTRKPGTP